VEMRLLTPINHNDQPYQIRMNIQNTISNLIDVEKQICSLVNDNKFVHDEPKEVYNYD
jgi:hypothetical protein